MIQAELGKERESLYLTITTSYKVSERISAADKLAMIDAVLKMPYEMVKEMAAITDEANTREYELGEVE